MIQNQMDLEYSSRRRAERTLFYMLWVVANGIILIFFGSPNGLYLDRTSASYFDTTSIIFPFSGGTICKAPCFSVYDYTEFIVLCVLPPVIYVLIKWLVPKKKDQ